MEDQNEPNRILVQFQQNNIYTDLIVNCYNGTLQCHRALISLCFPWPLPPDLDCLILPDVDLQIFQERLEAFYLTLIPTKLTDIFYKTCKVEPLEADLKLEGLTEHGLLDDDVDDEPIDELEDAEERLDDPETEAVDDTPSKASPEYLMFYCYKCQSSFDTLDELNQHKTTHKIDRGYRCDQCLKVMETKILLKRHMKTHSSLKCGICDEEFKSSDELTEHRKHHKPAKAKESCPCDICGKVLGSRHLLHRHKIRVHLKPEGFPCEYCDYKTNNNKNLRRHIEFSHLGIKYECTTCSEFFASKSSLYMHQNVHSDERPFICTECGDRFKWKKNLESHMHNKHSKMTFPCGQCGREFKNHSYLEYHLKSHDTNQQFPCEVCGKRFVTKTKLKMHKNIHTGEKPYKCPNLMCEKSYHSSDQLSHHKKNCLKALSILKLNRQDSPTTTIVWSI